MVQNSGTGTRHDRAEYLYADRLGSIVASFTRSGWVRAINSYDEFGVPGAASGTANTGRFRYTGQIYIPALGQYHYKARAYSPTLGRFMQTDPIGYGDGLNMYAYVGNDPVNAVDPLGLQSVGPDPEIFVPGDRCPGAVEIVRDGHSRCSFGFEGISAGLVDLFGAIIALPDEIGEIVVTGLRPTEDKEEREDSCALVRGEDGPLEIKLVEVTSAAGLRGGTVVTGTFTVQDSGSKGKFIAAGPAVGFSLGGSSQAGAGTDVRSLEGFALSFNGGFSSAAFSISIGTNLLPVLSFGVGTAINRLVSGGAGVTYATLFDCEKGGSN